MVLLLRAVWLLTFTLLVGLYTLALPLRIAVLTTVLPFGGSWSSLTLGEAQVLTSWGIPLPAYFWTVLLAELLLAATTLTLSALIVWRQPSNTGALITALLCISLGCSESNYTQSLGTLGPRWSSIHLGLQAIAIYLGLVIFYIFPDGRFVPRPTRWLALVYGVLIVIWLFVPAMPFSPLPGGNLNATPLGSLFFTLSWQASGVIAMVIRYRNHSTPTQRRQMQWAVFGLLIGLAVVISYYLGRWIVRFAIAPSLAPQFVYELLSNLLYELTLIGIAGCFTMAMLRYRLWGIETVIRRTLLYGALSTTLVAVGGITVLVSQALLRNLTSIDNELTAVMTTMVCMLLVGPLYPRFQGLIDRRFDRVTIDFRPTVIAFTRALNQRRTTPELLDALLRTSTDLLKISYGVIYLRAQDDQFHLSHAQAPPADTPTTLDRQTADQLKPDTEWHRPTDQRWPLILPLTALRDGDRTVIGTLALGPRRSEEPYTRVTIELLLALAERTGTAIAVAQLVAYQLAPAGRAEALAQTLARAPETEIATLQRLAGEALASAEAAAILAALPAALQRHDAPTLADLATGYRLIVEGHHDPTLLIAGLRMLAEAPAVPAPSAQLYQLCHIALDATSVTDLGALAAPVQALVLDSAPAAPLAAALTSFAAILDTLAALPRQVTTAGQVTCLQQARAQLELLEGRLPDALTLVARQIARSIASHWLARIDQHLQDIQGRAQLALRLITGSVVAAPEITLALELTNHGYGPARAVALRLLPEDGIIVQDPEQQIAELPAGETRLITFVLRPDGGAALRPILRLTYADAAGDRAPQTQTLAVAVLTSPPWRAPLANPYIAGMPLRSGSQVFVGRTGDIAAITRAISRPLPTALVLTGQRRMGKTSLLQQLGDRMGDSVVAVYLDGQRLAIDPGLPQLLAGMAARIAAALALPAPDPARFAVEPASAFADEFLPTILAAAGERRLLLLLDEIEALEERSAQGRLDPAFFGYLRHLMQHESRLTLVIAGAHRLDELRPAAWAGIFNAALHHRLSGLGSDEARALISAPLSDALRYDELAIDQLLRLSGGQPYFLQLLCQTLVDAANTRQQSVITLEHVLAVREHVLELGEAPLADLWSDSSADEQAVLAALTRTLPLTTAKGTGHLIAAMQARGLTLAKPLIEAALQRLAWRDLLQGERDEAEEGGLRYRWRLGLLSYWVAQTQRMP